MALADAQLRIGEAVPLLRQGPQRLGQDAELLHSNSQLARLRSEESAGDADEIADFKQLDQCVPLFADDVAAELDLDLPGLVAQVGERRAAVAPPENQPARDAHLGVIVVLLRGLVARLADRLAVIERAGVGIDAQLS